MRSLLPLRTLDRLCYDKVIPDEDITVVDEEEETSEEATEAETSEAATEEATEEETSAAAKESK